MWDGGGDVTGEVHLLVFWEPHRPAEALSKATSKSLVYECLGPRTARALLGLDEWKMASGKAVHLAVLSRWH